MAERLVGNLGVKPPTIHPDGTTLKRHALNLFDIIHCLFASETLCNDNVL